MGARGGRARRRQRRGPTNRMGLVAGLLIVLLLLAYLAFVDYVRPDPTGDELALDRFVTLIEEERVNDARILDQDGMVVGTYEAEAGPVVPYHVPYPQGGMVRDVLAQRLIEAGVPTAVDQQFLKLLLVPATLLFPALILVVIFVYLIVSYRQGTGMFGVRSGARRSRSDDTPVTFADVAGQDAAVAELREVAQFLTAPERFTAVGAKVPKGVLLYGPPGCGKTLLARALAGESGAAFFSITGSDFVELYVGVGASRVRDLFRQARDEAPAIVFIDELDAVGRRRGGGARAAAGGREEHEQALNQILAELDGFSPLEGIIVVAATNRPDVLDPALLRPGRFDRAIGLELPGENGRREILAVHAAGKALDDGVDLGRVAHRTVGMTGADLASVMNEAALIAGREGRTAISQDDLDRAVDRLRDEPDRQRRLSARDRSVGAGAGGQHRTTFADVAGAEEAIAELVDVRDYLEAPERFAAVGARPSHGFLLVGPPGVGKTLLARAVAGESNAAFLSVAATEFTEVYVGEGAARVRDLFAEARTLAPAIVFIDELDAIGARRGSGTDGHREREQTLNQILIELDGFSARSGVIVMAASNRPELLDPALVRPGRFDRTITVDLPDRAAREEILALHAADKPLADDVDLGVVAELTRGMSGADLATVLNDAALLTARSGLDRIPPRLVEQAIERASVGVGRNRVMGEDERRVIATHEAGHALLAWSLPTGRLPHRLSIVGHGRALGATWHREPRDRLVHSRSGLSDEMTLLLGGQAAERLVFGEPSSSAADDLSRAARIARRMVCELGMSERLGAATYAPPGGEAGPPWSEETARIIDEEMRRLLTEAGDRATAILTASRASLDALTEALLEQESLTEDDIRALAGEPGQHRHGADPGEERPPARPRPRVPTT